MDAVGDYFLKIQEIINIYSLLYLPSVVVASVEYIKRIINTAIYKSRCNWEMATQYLEVCFVYFHLIEFYLEMKNTIRNLVP